MHRVWGLSCLAFLCNFLKHKRRKECIKRRRNNQRWEGSKLCLEQGCFGGMSEIGSTWNGILKKEGKPGIMLACGLLRGMLCFVLFYYPQHLPHGIQGRAFYFAHWFLVQPREVIWRQPPSIADTCIKAGIKAGRYCKSHGLCVCLCVWFMTVSRISTPGRQTHFQQTPGYLRVTALLQDRYPNVTQPSREGHLHRTSWQRNSNQRGSWVSGN